MKILGVVIGILALAAYSRATVCNIEKDCSEMVTSNCTSLYGAFARSDNKVIRGTQQLIQDHLSKSMNMLNMATIFGDVKTHRHGFYKYYEKLSDDLWEDGLRILGQFTKRGGQLDELFIDPLSSDNLRGHNEVKILGLALEQEKLLWSKTQQLIYEATHTQQNEDRRDAHFAHFLVDEVAEKHVDRIKNLSNHVNTLMQLLATGDEYLAMFLYETEFLK